MIPGSCGIGCEQGAATISTMVDAAASRGDNGRRTLRLRITASLDPFLAQALSTAEVLFLVNVNERDTIQHACDCGRFSHACTWHVAAIL